MGWFGLKGEGLGSSEPKPVIILPSQAEKKVAGVVVGRRHEEEDWDFLPKVLYKRKKR